MKEALLQLELNEGLNKTGVEGIDIYKMTSPFPKTQVLVPPSICFIAQGEKSLYLGPKKMDYAEGQFLLGSLRMPVESELRVASKEKPYLGFILSMDSNIISELLMKVNHCKSWSEKEKSHDLIATDFISKDISTSIVGFLGILNDPEDRKVLLNAKIKEIYYRVLKSPIGYMLRNCAIQHSKAHQIAPVIQFIEKNFKESISIDDLTKVAGMSSTSLHESFKSTTSLSPIQFIKKIRLHNAYSLLTSGNNATDSAFASGYSSPAQFSREFKRQFGMSPREVRSA